jgi:hypothetical protein
MTKPSIAILGWGSLIWDTKHKGAAEFARWHGPWLDDGPMLSLEFSRISVKSRPGALTLVIDRAHGTVCRVKYCFSKRSKPEEVFEDLRTREDMPRREDGGVPRTIGRAFRGIGVPVCRDGDSLSEIQDWARRKEIDVVVWVDLSGNFENEKKVSYSVAAALEHLATIEDDVLSATREYVNRAPACVQTEFRRAFEASAYARKPKCD